MTTPQTCEHTYRDGSGLCGRPELQGRRCIFHGVDPPHAQDEFLAELDRLIAAGEENWREFHFPRKFVLDGRNLAAPVNLTGSQFYELQVKDLTFERSVNMADCTFSGETVFVGRLGSTSDTIGSRRITFQGSHFQKHVRFNSKCFAQVDFQRAVFEESAEFVGGWTHILHVGAANIRLGTPSLTAFSGQRTLYQAFVGAIRQSVENTKRRIADDWRATKENAVRRWETTHNIASNIKQRYFAQDVDNLSTETLNQVFYDEVSLDHVQFLKPERVYFRLVRLAKARVDNSDVSKVHLIDVDWRQPKLGRSGLYEDVSLRFNSRPEDYRKSLKRLEYQYRSIRRALEDGKMFDVASDFYVGEMECKRIGKGWPARYLFSIPALYNLLCKYGTDAGRAFAVLFCLISLHWITSIMLLDRVQIYPDLSNQLVDSIRVATLQRRDNPEQALLLCDTILRVLGPFQIALIGLSLRSRIRRF